MERLKKYLVILVVAIVVLAAIITALRMTSNSRPSNNTVGVTKGFGAPGVTRSSAPMDTVMSATSGRDSMEGIAVGEMAPMADVESVPIEKKEIKNGSLTMRVNDVDRAVEQMTAVATEHKGEVYSSNFYQDTQDIKSGTVEVRVPVDQFGSTFEALKKVATVVVGESTSGQDVTLAYRDLQARLKNKQAEEQSFLKILEQSGKLSDVIDVTREVSRVRGEIEQLQAQITYMESQTDYATITISVTEDENVTFSDQWRPLQVAKETINGLLSDMQGFVNFVIVLVIRVIPIMILYGFIAWVFYVVVKKIIHALRGKKNDVSVNNQ
ncbi:MAG: DUF4349 domain-containing protein [Parcubacteria group bacterium]|jgi:hypothetical protein